MCVRLNMQPMKKEFRAGDHATMLPLRSGVSLNTYKPMWIFLNSVSIFLLHVSQCLDFYVLCMKIYNLCLHFSVLCAKVCYLSADTLLQLRHPNWFRTTGKTVEWLLFGPVFTHIGLDGARVRLFTLARVRNSIFVTLSSHPIGCVTCCQELIIAMARHLLTFNNGPTSPNIQYSANTAHT